MIISWLKILGHRTRGWNGSRVELITSNNGVIKIPRSDQMTSDNVRIASIQFEGILEELNMLIITMNKMLQHLASRF
jgi:hypothetical protein